MIITHFCIVTFLILITLDQPVPKGLHYRLNMATGLVEAKLLDESEDTQESGNKNKPASGLVATGNVYALSIGPR